MQRSLSDIKHTYLLKRIEIKLPIPFTKLNYVKKEIPGGWIQFGKAKQSLMKLNKFLRRFE